jgi:type IV pilus assembly protein PilW
MTALRPPEARRPRGSHGFTLIELLVAVAVGMAMTLVVTLTLTRFETDRRTLTSINDGAIGGAYLSHTLDRSIRSAGSGFMQSWANAGGCRVLASRNGTQVLPRTAAWPAPFASVPQTVRLAPVVVHAGAGTGGSDVIAVQAGSSGLGETPMAVQPGSVGASGADSSLRLASTVGLRGGDLMLVYQTAADCMLQQVRAGFSGGATQPLDFGGTYADVDIGGVELIGIGVTEPAWVVPLGNTAGARPQFQLIGVGDNATLVGMDMLRLDDADAVVALADGVADLRVRYGVDTTGDGRIDSWQNPAGADWSGATLQSGTAAANARLGQILALRIALVTRTQVPERDARAPEALVLFPDLDAALRVTRTLTADERRLHWRVIDLTVPLRNTLLLF